MTTTVATIINWDETVIIVKRSELPLHAALVEACNRAKEGEFVPAHFVQVMMERQKFQIEDLKK